MRDSQFKALLAMLPGLSPKQLADQRSEAERIHDHSRALSSIEEAMAGAGCPHCNSFKGVKNGTGRGMQRYRCMDCSKTFNAATNTTLAHLHSKKQFFQHGECLQKGLTIRATAKELGVSLSTAFRWRHRFLAAVVGHQPKGVTGIFEADETYFISSETCAYPSVGATYLGEIDPGTFLTMMESGEFRTTVYAEPKKKQCVFELVYYAHPASNVFGHSVGRFRQQLGRRLESELGVPEADIVLGIPDSSDRKSVV